MGWVRDKFGVPVFERDGSDEKLLEQARRAQEEFGFTDAERIEFERVQRAALANPQYAKKLARRVRRFKRAARMSPTIKARPYRRTRRSK